MDTLLSPSRGFI